MGGQAGKLGNRSSTLKMAIALAVVLFQVGFGVRTVMAGTDSGKLTAGPAVTITPDEQGSFTDTVGSFSDTNTAKTAADFTVSIDWGDNTTSPATVSGSGGSFSVAGTHTYAEDGTFPGTFTVTELPGGTPKAFAFTAVVREFSLSITSATANATAGKSFTAVLATAQDPGATDPASAYAATIDFGDGTSVRPGVVGGTATPGHYTVSGTHTYASPGTFHPIVRFFEKNSPTLSGATVATVNVS